MIEHDAEENAEKHFEHLAQDIRNDRQGTIEELAVPAEGDYNIDNRVEDQTKPTDILQAKL